VAREYDRDFAGRSRSFVFYVKDDDEAAATVR
jgi:hypothetical protein